MRRSLTTVRATATGLSLMGAVATGSFMCAAQQAPPRAMPVSAAAAPIEHVVELFTSQGCSSCPKADALFSTYVQKPGVLALSFSVDYWDYLGWRDTLAHAAFTHRQKHYAKLRGDGKVYTPQIIVNGHAHAVGNSAPHVDRLIADAVSDRARPWHAVSATQASITVPPTPSGRTSTLWLVRYVDRVDVEIKRGENAGKTITYVNVVRGLEDLGSWNGSSPLAQSLAATQLTPQTEGERRAILIQDVASGRVVGAARLE